VKWTQLLLILFLAAVAFGGSFTCKPGNDDTHVTASQSLTHALLAAIA
jgi:hypothetical protein